MIKHLIKIIWNQRKRNGWIAAELLIVLVIMWFIIDSMYVVGRVYFSPQGYDIDHTYLVNMGVEEMKEDPTLESKSLGEDLLTVLQRIKTCPGVEAVGMGWASMPFDGHNSYRSICVKDSLRIRSCRYLKITPGYMDVFRFTLTEGNTRNWNELLENDQVIVSGSVYKQILEMEGSREKGITYSQNFDDDEAMKISGVTTFFRKDRYSKDGDWIFNLLSESDIADSKEYGYKIVIRVTPEADHNFARLFEEQMGNQLSVGSFYLMDIFPYYKQRENYELLTGERSLVKNKLAIMGFLLFNIFLGIIGTFWFRTEQRKEEMGLRIAIGSTRNGLREVMIGEGLVLLTLMAIPAFVICLNLQFAEITNGYYMDYSLVRLLTGFIITYLLLAIMIILGIWYPAQQISRLQPAEALHYE